jgi:hypothetical protein
LSGVQSGVAPAGADPGKQSHANRMPIARVNTRINPHTLGNDAPYLLPVQAEGTGGESTTSGSDCGGTGGFSLLRSIRMRIKMLLHGSPGLAGSVCVIGFAGGVCQKKARGKRTRHGLKSNSKSREETQSSWGCPFPFSRPAESGSTKAAVHAVCRKPQGMEPGAVGQSSRQQRFTSRSKESSPRE